MCKSIDVAIAMVNRSIDLADDGKHPEYYMDFVKLHKLMYAGCCYLRAKYDMALFEEKVSVHHCGPLVDGLSQIPGICGFDLIREPLNPADFGTIDMPLSYFRKEAIEKTLEKIYVDEVNVIPSYFSHHLWPEKNIDYRFRSYCYRSGCRI